MRRRPVHKAWIRDLNKTLNKDDELKAKIAATLFKQHYLWVSVERSKHMEQFENQITRDYILEIDLYTNIYDGI